ncbi:YkuS family protein [Bacillus sp. DTU_2020_1000418_1_SI_GHA_SEK_038]|uniref:YkuS family protein n=1 Tax=Bacillus sp. DTU_2020_1000418_1_SI_GHA_SEK_038 TaxID=3077585 RepID=UPI0028EF3B3D|nr:YkuS family protein [Bacillus sp. DTU_2020_1000418_1_SI_GHA_SEK_038]WNS73505.1 YkuS family protein [Bacillus sp. DTU_2020_1000418_1_SI_GHA_SEK_038]
MKKIAVEQSLTNVSDALREKGYDVVDLRSAADAENCSACVVTGMDNNFMGMHDIVTKAPVIEASGLSADEVCQQVEQRLQ